ncbi:chloride channel CLIC-like protein 1 [Brachionichthys hirsutus]|uniref:chloride channel CLIC-like protein 1 n=1 Tax=Brachionichthys hirsutus TaxID=412623 RepID=UPI0036046219
MLLAVSVFILSLTAAEHVEDDWVDPYDMFNYDASSKTMRKPAEQTTYPDVPTKRREYSQDSIEMEQTCHRQVLDLQAQIEEQKKKIKRISQQPTCTPVFKRFLSRLLKEIERVGLPSDSADVFYDAKIRLSRQSIAEIQTLLEGEESWRTGALDNAVSQILVGLRAHDYEAWRWRFEDTFGVELDTLLKIGLFVMVMVVIICTQLWSKVSWFMQFSRLFALCFIVSVIWNWVYLYKIAFADHQKHMVKLDGVSEKCTGRKKIDWIDSLKEVFRSSFSLQDDPCKKYYEVLFVNPLLLVPPTKAISVTIVTVITEPLKHIGEGISDFIRALLKDLPVTLQIPVFLTIVVAIVVFMYGGVQAVFQYGIMAPFRRPQRDPPPPRLQQHHLEEIEGRHYPAGGDAPQNSLRHRANGGTLHRNNVHQRRPDAPRAEPAEALVETLHTAERPCNEDESHARQNEEEQNLSAESDPENQPKTQEELVGADASSVGVKTVQSKANPTQSHSSQSGSRSFKAIESDSKDECSDGSASKPKSADGNPPRQKRDLKVSAEDGGSSDSLSQVETIGVSVQESSPAEAE